MTAPHRLAEYLRARTSDARIDRQWAAIEAAGLPGPVPARSRSTAFGVVGMLVAVVAAAAALVYVRTPRALPAGALLESAEAPIAVRLEDGSRVELTPRSQLRLVDNRTQAVALELRSGTARFRVTHDRQRPFAVEAGPAEVRVIGTQFELAREPAKGGARIHLAVTEGLVEVRRRDLRGEPPQRIRQGETWSAWIPDGAVVAAAPMPEPTPEPELEPEPPPVEAPPDATGDTRTRPASSSARPQPEADASALFGRANLARRAGRMRDAAEGYAELLRRFPNDSRAGLSTFELGRIRMDALADPQGAIVALEQALQSSGAASFHADALARIVTANDALGRTEACRAARERYHDRYPNGMHGPALAALCR
jgi:TolA-binding protein